MYFPSDDTTDLTEAINKLQKDRAKQQEGNGDEAGAGEDDIVVSTTKKSGAALLPVGTPGAALIIFDPHTDLLLFNTNPYLFVLFVFI